MRKRSSGSSAPIELGRLFENLTRPLFGHPLAAAAHALSLPLAYFDWSMGEPSQDAETWR